ncbi:MAG: PilZ domain-containing protein [Myxococcales bacterium]|nr:PilZ domain-containing protein [Myxococcales bacterium]
MSKGSGAHLDETTSGRGGVERRRTQRVPVEMWVEQIGDDERVFRRAGNLSAGGLHLDKTIPIPVGTHVFLRFTLPGDADAIAVDGKIVAIDPDEELGMGVQFLGLAPAAEARIARYLTRALTPLGVEP